MAIRSGTGQGGKSMQDRELAAKVRTQLLEDIYSVMIGSAKIKRWSKFKMALVMKMSNSALPRLNEHTGADGGQLEVKFDSIFSAKTSSKTD